MSKKIVIIGAGGHAKVIADIVIKCSDVLLGFLDDKIKGEVIGYPILGKCSEISTYMGSAEFIIGIGNNLIRKSVAKSYPIIWYTAIHPSSQIGMDVKIGQGSVIMANATINTSAKIGNHCIINTGATVEHDNAIDDYVHISPNATICGTVHIGKCTHIGAGAVVKNNIEICDNCIIGAGTVVVSDILQSGTYIGIPARRVYK